MKNPILHTLTLLLALSLGVQSVSAQITQKRLPVPDYRAVVARHGINVTLTKRPSKEILIKADQSVIDFVKVACDMGTLSIQMETDSRIMMKNREVEVIVPLNDRLDLIEANSSADIRSERPIKGDGITFRASSSARIVAAAQCKTFNGYASSSADLVIAVEATHCDLKATSSADIKCSIKADDSQISATSSAEIEAENHTRNRCTLDATSSAEIELEGTAQELTVKTSSSGEIKAEDFYVGNAEADATSGSYIELNFTHKLIARASSGGRICYTGPGTDIDARTSSGGSVRSLK